MTHQHGPNELARAVLEGVGYALADGMDVVHACGIKPQSVTLIGGGRVVSTGVKCWRTLAVSNWITARVAMWGQHWRSKAGADCGESRKTLIELLPQLPLEQSHLPDAQRYAAYQPRRETFRRLISNFCH